VADTFFIVQLAWANTPGVRSGSWALFDAAGNQLGPSNSWSTDPIQVTAVAYPTWTLADAPADH
jgi:hypothetical protein